MSFEEAVEKRIARLSERREDWDTLGFQAAVDDKYKRAQIRYIGSGATGNHEDDPTIIPSEHFTLSTMVLPPGGEGPLHLHSDAEEGVFVPDGDPTFLFTPTPRPRRRSSSSMASSRSSSSSTTAR